MKSLMDINGGVHRHFLTGVEELEAFRSNEFIRMHNSTLCKLGFFHSTLRKAISGRLKTKSKGFGVSLDRLFESRFAKGAALLATIIAIILFGSQAVDWVKPLIVEFLPKDIQSVEKGVAIPNDLSVEPDLTLDPSPDSP